MEVISATMIGSMKNGARWPVCIIKSGQAPTHAGFGSARLCLQSWKKKTVSAIVTPFL
jgi:hypothetical protein